MQNNALLYFIFKQNRQFSVINFWDSLLSPLYMATNNIREIFVAVVDGNCLFSLNRKTNIFDSMIYMMENYADNLEDLVAERTGQLFEAKRGTEDLLYKILPKYEFRTNYKYFAITIKVSKKSVKKFLVIFG